MKVPKIKIHWINESAGCPRDEAGHLRSMEGRFDISPRYRSTVYPDSYSLSDNERKDGHCFVNYPTIRECKQHAVRIITAEITELLGGTQ